MSGIPGRTGKDLLQSGILSDFVVNIGGKQIRTHRCILATSSEYFNSLFRSDFKEARDGTVDLSQHDFDAVQQMIQFIYTGSCELAAPPEDSTVDNTTNAWAYEGMSRPIAENVEKFKRNVTLYQTADFFGVLALKEQVVGRIMRLIDYSSMVQHDSFPELLELVYTTTRREDDILRPYVTETCFHEYHKAKGKIHKGVPEMVAKHEAIAWKVAMKAYRKLHGTQSAMEGLYGVINKLQDQKTTQDNEIARLKAETDLLSQQIKNQAYTIDQYWKHRTKRHG